MHSNQVPPLKHDGFRFVDKTTNHEKVIIKTSKYKIQESKGHGKACNGAKKTATIQVTEPFGNGYGIVKQFRFVVEDIQSRKKAMTKAATYIAENSTKEKNVQ